MQHNQSFYEVPCEVTGLSPWQRFKRFIVGPFKWCCIDATDEQDFSYDVSIRREVNREFLRKPKSRYLRYDDMVGTDAVIDAMLETASGGYDLGIMPIIRDANRGVTRTIRGWREYFGRLNIDVGLPHEPEDGEDEPVEFGLMVERYPNWLGVDHEDYAKVVPRFAAAVAIDLRSRLGPLPYNEANLLLVQRKYLEVCRNRGVHRTDVVAHEQYVINVFFGDKLFERVATVRTRLPGWLKWAYDVPDVDRRGPVAC
jgi:hypothetical protein